MSVKGLISVVKILHQGITKSVHTLDQKWQKDLTVSKTQDTACSQKCEIDSYSKQQSSADISNYNSQKCTEMHTFHVFFF